MKCKPRLLPWMLIMFALLIPLGTASWSQSTIPPDILLAGKADFMTYCATCHGRQGVGDGPVAKQLVSNPADLTLLKKNNGGTFSRRKGSPDH